MCRAALVLALLLAACGGCGGVQVTPPRDDRERMVNLASQAVKVEVDCEDHDGWGSGVKFGSYHGSLLVATAAHVVDDAECTYSVDQHDAFVVAFDEDDDVAMIVVRGMGGVPLASASRTYLGQPVVTIGYPAQHLGNDGVLQVSRGHILVYLKDMDRYRVDSIAYYGNSGGPVFDERGQLVGLLVSMAVRNGAPLDGAYYVTPAENVFDAYQDVFE